jgi:hypothetical protein
MRLTVARMPNPLISYHSPKRHTSHPVAWRQSLAVTAALLVALVLGAAPGLAHASGLPRQVAQITVGPGPPLPPPAGTTEPTTGSLAAFRQQRQAQQGRWPRRRTNSSSAPSPS